MQKRKELVDVQKKEIMNELTFNADFYIHVKEGFNIQSKTNPMFVTKVGDSEQKTNSLKGKTDPVWDENFKFNIPKGEIYAEFLLVDKQDGNKEATLGTCKYDMRNLFDQRPRNEQ